MAKELIGDAIEHINEYMKKVDEEQVKRLEQELFERESKKARQAIKNAVDTDLKQRIKQAYSEIKAEHDYWHKISPSQFEARLSGLIYLLKKIEELLNATK